MSPRDCSSLTFSGFYFCTRFPTYSILCVFCPHVVGVLLHHNPGLVSFDYDSFYGVGLLSLKLRSKPLPLTWSLNVRRWTYLYHIIIGYSPGTVFRHMWRRMGKRSDSLTRRLSFPVLFTTFTSWHRSLFLPLLFRHSVSLPMVSGYHVSSQGYPTTFLKVKMRITIFRDRTRLFVCCPRLNP